jgi:hypothetical protein
MTLVQCRPDIAMFKLRDLVRSDLTGLQQSALQYAMHFRSLVLGQMISAWLLRVHKDRIGGLANTVCLPHVQCSV